MKFINNKNNLITLATLMGLSASSFGAGLSEMYDTPEWTKGMSLSASFVSDSIDIENTFINGADSQGLQLEVAKEFALADGFTTESVLVGKTTDAEDEYVNIENKGIGLMQRISRPIEMNNQRLIPSFGLGAMYGGLEYEFSDEDQQYLMVNAEAKVSYEFSKGIAPFVKYSYGIGDLEDTPNEVEVSSVSGGLSVIF